MKKLFLGLIVLMFSCGYVFAANENFDTKLYVYDAGTGGNVTNLTKNIIILMGVKGSIPQTVNNAALDYNGELTLSRSQIFMYDFQGNSYSLIQSPNIWPSDLNGKFVANGYGETLVALGSYSLKKFAPTGLTSKFDIQKGVILNALFDVKNETGTTITQALRASKVISFSEKTN